MEVRIWSTSQNRDTQIPLYLAVLIGIEVLVWFDFSLYLASHSICICRRIGEGWDRWLGTVRVQWGVEGRYSQSHFESLSVQVVIFESLWGCTIPWMLRSLVVRETWLLGPVSPRMHASPLTLWTAFAQRFGTQPESNRRGPEMPNYVSTEYHQPMAFQISDQILKTP